MTPNKAMSPNKRMTPNKAMTPNKNLGFIKAETLKKNPNAKTMKVGGKTFPIE